MLMLSQCVNFEPYAGTFWKHWGGATQTNCDWKEVQDLLEFQELIGGIPTKVIQSDPYGRRWPDFTSLPVPLSAVIVAHHNLVTYGVPFLTKNPNGYGGYWTNPPGMKRFYTPVEAIKDLATSEVFNRAEDEEEVVKKFIHSDLTLDIPGKPGMKDWVTEARQKYAKPCTDMHTGSFECRWYIAWAKWHSVDLVDVPDLVDVVRNREAMHTQLKRKLGRASEQKGRPDAKGNMYRRSDENCFSQSPDLRHRRKRV